MTQLPVDDGRRVITSIDPQAIFEDDLILFSILLLLLYLPIQHPAMGDIPRSMQGFPYPRGWVTGLFFWRFVIYTGCIKETVQLQEVEMGEPLQKNGQRPMYERIYEVVKQVPPGRVTTYGRVAQIVGNCSARMVGYALAALPDGLDVPWQRVINWMGKISVFGDGFGNAMQRALLEQEGIVFDAEGRVDLDEVGWPDPTE